MIDPQERGEQIEAGLRFALSGVAEPGLTEDQRGTVEWVRGRWRLINARYQEAAVDMEPSDTEMLLAILDAHFPSAEAGDTDD